MHMFLLFAFSTAMHHQLGALDQLVCYLYLKGKQFRLGSGYFEVLHAHAHALRQVASFSGRLFRSNTCPYICDEETLLQSFDLYFFIYLFSLV